MAAEGETTESSAKAESFLARIFWDLCWIVALAGALTVLFRVVAHDANLLLVWANSFSLYIYLPALLILLLATMTRRRKLAALCLVPVIGGAIWIAPDFQQAATVSPTDEQRPRLRIFNANLYAGNPDPQGILAEIAAADADLLLLQEYSPAWHRAITLSPLVKRFPYQVVKVRDDNFGIAVYSKRPLVQRTVWATGKVPIIAVTIEHDGQPVRIYNWHPLPPRSFSYVSIWNAQYQDLMDRLATEAGPTMIIGDFNATQHAYWMQQLREAGFQSSHLDRGRGFAVTYPNGTSRIPPIRIDHALLSGQLRCVDIREGIGAGSDHKPLVADFVLVADDAN